MLTRHFQFLPMKLKSIKLIRTSVIHHKVPLTNQCITLNIHRVALTHTAAHLVMISAALEECRWSKTGHVCIGGGCGGGGGRAWSGAAAEATEWGERLRQRGLSGLRCDPFELIVFSPQYMRRTGGRRPVGGRRRQTRHTAFMVRAKK